MQGPSRTLLTIASQTGGMTINDPDTEVVLSAVRAMPSILRGESVGDAVAFEGCINSGDLRTGGTVTGTLNVDLSTNSPSAGVLMYAFPAPVSAATTSTSVSAPFRIEIPATSSGRHP